jgi:hypothetical protein
MVRSQALLTASSGRAEQLFPEVFPWLAALIGFIIVGSIVITAVRRWQRGTGRSQGESFTLHDLRELHRQGQLSDEEFERARQAIIDQVKRSTSENEREPRPDAEGDSPQRGEDPDRFN